MQCENKAERKERNAILEEGTPHGMLHSDVLGNAQDVLFSFNKKSFSAWWIIDVAVHRVGQSVSLDRTIEKGIFLTADLFFPPNSGRLANFQ